MDRFKKKNMLQAVSTLIEANDFICKMASGDPPKAVDLLTQCQETAIKTGVVLEQLDERYALIVKKLEDYCEDIYQMSVHLSDENQCRKLSKRIRRQLNRIQSDIASEMPDDRREVVFLPYKASMWDSLESVWKRADEDEHTDAYVVPIPYYDKNPDGSFCREHYEVDLYPDYVPVVRYEEYDFEGRRPDAIYIHTPYDEANYVTSVAPFFYARNLRRYTDELIYIPYFVLDEIEPDDQAAIEGIKHFCFLPGVIYAHKVIVQSEKMRQIYINEYIKAAKAHGLSGEHTDRAFLEKKICGFGSPKIDKILNTKKEDIFIPDSWKKIMEKADGSRKKVIFYNTSIHALLQHNDKMLKKMESVFQIFYENRERLALLWRPHPLIESTLQSMRPTLWEEYKRIRDKYIQGEWGIYDDTPDIDRAIVVSDAYYGDQSSVVQMYMQTGKPLMIQSVEAEVHL